MDFPSQNTQPTEPELNPDRGVATSPVTSTKVLGIERRLIGFGFGLLLMLVILAVLYTVYTQDRTVTQTPASRTTPTSTTSKSAAVTTPAPTTPDTAVTDLVDEALADSDDVDALDADEVADIEDGSNN